MNEITVVFRSVAELRDFVGIANRQPYSIRLTCGSAVFNAKSILSLFCVQLGAPLALQTQAGVDASEFIGQIAPYCAGASLSV